MSCVSSGFSLFRLFRLHLYLIDLQSMLLCFKYEDLLDMEEFFAIRIYCESVCLMPLVGLASDRDQLHN